MIIATVLFGSSALSPALWRLLTQASREPAPFVLGLAMLAGFVSVLSEPLAWIPAAAAFVMLLQMLRVLWRRCLGLD